MTAVLLLSLSFVPILIRSEPMTRLKFQCETWKQEHPMENGVTDNCSMKVKQRDISEFEMQMKNSDFAWYLFRFYLKFEVNETFETKCVVEPHLWTWTYPAPKGAYQFLKWPKEYGIWSFGLLDMYSYGPMNISMEINGSCPVIIGQSATTQRIGVALLEMVNMMPEIPESFEDIRYGSVCYNERVYLAKNVLYSLCLHIICPLEAIGYKCCSTDYSNKSMVCDGDTIYFDDTWWAIPFVIGSLMFAFSPLLLTKIFHKTKNTDNIIIPDTDFSRDKWLICNPLSLFSILKACIMSINNFPIFTVILRRIAIALLTVSMIFIQVCIHYLYDQHYTKELVKHGVPLAFRSMAAGYQLSKRNFMPLIGGPYIGLGIYLVTTTLLVCIPRDLENLFNKGIPNNVRLSTSPLTMDMRTKAKLGSVYNIDRRSGYDKLYSLMKGHIFMLINPSFWHLTIQMQTRRYIGFLNSYSKSTPVFAMLIVGLTIPYMFVICTLEILLVVVYYGLPIVLFFQVTVTAYCKEVQSRFGGFGTVGKLMQYLLTITIVFTLVFNMYILTVVFVDSFLFMTRILIFTFTGFIAYPSRTYGYFVFIITVTMYVTESIQGINLTYCKLFKNVRKTTELIQKKNAFPAEIISQKNDDILLISRELFMYIVARHRPIRVEVFFSFLKLVFITFLLYIASRTIVTLQRLLALNALTQVVTALFICLLPKLWHMLLAKDDYMYNVRENLIIKRLVLSYCHLKLVAMENKKLQYDAEKAENSEQKEYSENSFEIWFNEYNISYHYDDENELDADLVLDSM